LHRAALTEVGQRVDQPVDEVPVAVAPPQEHRVGDVLVVVTD
jgi:hypothetical protein